MPEPEQDGHRNFKFGQDLSIRTVGEVIKILILIGYVYLFSLESACPCFLEEDFDQE